MDPCVCGLFPGRPGNGVKGKEQVDGGGRAQGRHDFEDGHRFVFDITSLVKTDFQSNQLVSLTVSHKDI